MSAVNGAEVALAIHALSVHYGQVAALDNASLTVASGRVCALVGVNGAGKSTLFKAVMGLVRPDSGSITIRALTPAQARKAGLVSYVPQMQDVDWNFPLSVQDVVMTGRYGFMGPTRRPRVRDRLAVAQALERVGMAQYATRPIGNLSGGQRKRAFVARAIAQEASVLLLDEPFAGVDKASEGALTATLRNLAADGGAILVSTHDLATVPALADDAALLQRRVLAHGSPREVLTATNLARAFGLDPQSIGTGIPA